MNKKNILRQEILKKLAKIIDFSNKDNDIYKNFFANYRSIIPNNVTIGAYIPIEKEYNIFPILEELEKRGHKIAIPFMKNDNDLEFSYWSSGEELENSKIFSKIREPRHKNIASNLEIVIVPLIGCDSECNRLGRGKGIYDKKIQQLLNLKLNTILLGLCYDEQIIEKVPIESHDKKLNYIISEKKIFRSKIN